MSTQQKRTAQQRREVLNSPLLRKSGVHQKSRKVVRRDDKMALRRQYCPQSTWQCALRAVLVLLVVTASQARF